MPCVWSLDMCAGPSFFCLSHRTDLFQVPHQWSSKDPGCVIVWTLLYQWQEMLKSTWCCCEVTRKVVMIAGCLSCVRHWLMLWSLDTHRVFPFFLFVASLQWHLCSLHWSHVLFHCSLYGVSLLTYMLDGMKSVHILTVLEVRHCFWESGMSMSISNVQHSAH